MISEVLEVLGGFGGQGCGAGGLRAVGRVRVATRGSRRGRRRGAGARVRADGPGADVTLMPGCIMEISCSQELPERGSLMTM